MIATPDELLVIWLQSLSSVITVCNSRVYHMEVFQSNNADNRYPCVVYRLSDQIPEKELAGTIGYDTYMYDVYTICTKSSDLRTVVEGIKNLGFESYNVMQWNAGIQGFEGIDVDSETEENEFAIEQQELGKKVSTQSVSIFFNRGVM